MNPPGGGAGDLIITVGGDLSPLDEALASVPEAFAGLTTGGEDAFAGLGAAADQATAAVNGLASAATDAIDPVTALGEELGAVAGTGTEELELTSEELQQISASAAQASSSIADLGAEADAARPSMTGLADAAAETSDSTVTMAASIWTALLAWSALESTLVDITTAYGDLQRAQIALGALLGNTSQADAAIDATKQLADSLGLVQASAISVEQQLVAVGEPLSAIPRDMTAIADGAAAMNTSFDTAAQRFDQIVNSGTLMSRSLTSIGVSTNDIASAMGMAGVPANDLTTAFKGLDEAQRAAVISMAELSKNANVAAEAATGVSGAWTQVKNSMTDAMQAIGQQVNGFAGLATAAKEAVDLIAQAFIGLTATIKIVVDGIIALFQTMVTPLALIGQVIEDAFTGHFKAIPGDITAANGAIEDALNSGLQNIEGDVSGAGNAVAKLWGDSMTSVSTSTGTATTSAAGSLNVLQAAAQKAASDFGAVAVAFENGKVSATVYTQALTALNKAQMDANGGLEQFGTAVLIAANNFRQETADLMNASTTLGAVQTAAESGASTWTAYDAALKALNQDQMAFNNGLQDQHTAVLLAQEDFNNMGVAIANAQTQLAAIVAVWGAAALGTKQYTDALNALQAAQENAAGGAMNLQTAVLQAANTQATANLQWHNAEVALQAAYQYYLQTGQGVQQLIDLTLKLTDAQTAATNGILSWTSAEEKLVADNTQLNVNLTNANTTLAQAQQLYSDGAIGLGQLEKAEEGVKSAQDALNGSTKTAATNQQAVNQAQDTYVSKSAAFGSAAAAVAGYWENIDGAMHDVATTYQTLNGATIVGTQDMTNQAAAASQVQTTYQVLNGTTIVASNNLNDLAAAANKVQTTLVTLNGTTIVSSQDMSQLASSASTAASGIDKVGTAATSASKSVQGFNDLISGFDANMAEFGKSADSLGSELDAALGATPGNVSASLSANQQYTQPYSGTVIGGSEGLGIQDPSELMSMSATAIQMMNMGETMTYDSTATLAATAATTANTAATAANTTATDASTATIAAATDTSAALANSLTNVWTQYQDGQASLQMLTDATTAAAASFAAGDSTLAAVWAQYQAGEVSLNDLMTATMEAADSLDGVTTSASDSIAALNALNDGTAPLAVSLAGMASEITQTTTAVAAAGAIVSSASTALAASVTAALGPALGVGGTLGIPAIGTTTPVIGTSGTATGQTLNPAYSGNFTINVNAGTVVGAGGMQQLANTVGNQLVKNLNQSGIRITRQ